MKFFRLIFIFGIITFAIFGFSLGTVKADGGVFYPPSYYMNETGQKALIYYQDQTENLVISTSFEGNSKDFAWVIPTPSKPEIFKSSSGLFSTLEKITNTSDYVSKTSDRIPTLGLGTSESSVQVIEEKTIDIYDTAILQATDDKALAEWLTNHGYTFPKDKSYMLQDYINNGWYFAIAKIQNVLTENSDVKDQLSAGTITPLRLKFQSNKIIYPMKLTRLALDYAQENAPKKTDETISNDTSYPYSPTMQMNLYVLANSKTTQDKLETTWANWVNSKDTAELNNSIIEDDWITANKLFLTKMHSDINIKDIDNDFLITKTEDNSVYPTPVYKTAGFWFMNLLVLLLTIVIAVLTPIGLLFVIAVILQKFASRVRWLYILGSIYQVFACFFVLIFLTIYLIAAGNASGDFSKIFLESGFIGLTIGLLIIFATGIFLSIKMIKKYKKIYSASKI